MACKEGQFDVVELMVNDKFKTFSINLNAQHVNGMTPYVRLLDTLEDEEAEVCLSVYSHVMFQNFFPCLALLSLSLVVASC